MTITLQEQVVMEVTTVVTKEEEEEEEVVKIDIAVHMVATAEVNYNMICWFDFNVPQSYLFLCFLLF